ncbi:MAG TPA: PfkB family carbohydrate kinase [Prolixibacteraceae bacterium]|nr:PfkB family carbohydrate kinase [Prolixibacteraceae bacterium]
MNKRVLFIGLTTIDIQYFFDGFPLPNTKHKTEMPILAAGGPAANAAVTFARLGGEAHFLSCVGQNHFTEFVHNDYKACNVKLIDCFEGKALQPIIATIITNINNSERTILTHHPDNVEIGFDLESVEIGSYDAVFSDGFYPEIAVPLCQRAQSAGIPVILDGGSWKPQIPAILPHVDIAICSANFIPPTCKNYSDTIKYVMEQGVKKVAISRGFESIITNECEIKIERVEAIDSLGAGDVLHGAFIWYYFRCKTFTEALQKASIIATKSTMYKGTRSWMDQALAF